jgi:hypothetical protein
MSQEPLTSSLPATTNQAETTASAPASPIPVLITASAAALVGAFFLPWVELGGLVSTTGYNFALGPTSSGEQKMFVAVPLIALITVLAGLISRKQQRGAARIAGSLPLIGFIYILIRYGQDATQLFGAGAWISLCLGIVLLVLGCVRLK